MTDLHLDHLTGDALGLQIDDRILVAGLDCMFRRPTEKFLMWQSASDSAPAAVETFGDESVTIAVRYFILRSEEELTVIDTGVNHHQSGLAPFRTGEGIDRALGHIAADPRDVSRVVLTHLHMDHCGGVVDESGRLRFPNAEHLIHRAELDHWMSDGSPGGDVARATIVALRDARKLSAVDGRVQAIHSRLRVVHTPGHTPGHMSVELVDATGEVAAMVSGDLLHHPIQLANPGIGVRADLNPLMALQTRLQVLRRLADTATVMATGHFHDEPFYRLVRDGEQTYSRLALGGGARR